MKRAFLTTSGEPPAPHWAEGSLDAQAKLCTFFERVSVCHAKQRKSVIVKLPGASCLLTLDNKWLNLAVKLRHKA